MPKAVHLTAIIICPSITCDAEFEGSWTATELDPELDTMQDLEAPPEEVQLCPRCGYTWLAQWPGWAMYTDAG